MSAPYEGDSTAQATPGIKGTNNAGGDAVFGSATKGGRGAVGVSDTHTGVEGDSTSGAGVWGESQSGDGLHGVCHSSSAAGVAAYNLNGGLAGLFGGNVAVNGNFQVNGNGTVTGYLGVESGTQSIAGVRGANSAGGDAIIGTATKGGRGAVGVSDTHTGVEGDSTSGVGVWGESQGGDGLHGVSHSSSAAGVAAYNLNGGLAGLFGGNVQVNGNHNVSGTVYVTGDVVLTGADCAEQFDLGAAGSVEPGTVMVIDNDGALRVSYRAYDRAVAGVVSGAGAFRPGIILDRHGDDAGRAAIALVGKVYCKVDADAAPIAVGDLLTSSETPGHAMKAGDPLMAFGSVLGKALRPMESGRGLLPILVALQ